MIQSRNLTPNLSETQRLRARMIASCVMFALISIPLILRLVPAPTRIYGFRTARPCRGRNLVIRRNAFMGWDAAGSRRSSSELLMVMLPAAVKRWVLWIALWGRCSARWRPRLILYGLVGSGRYLRPSETGAGRRHRSRFLIDLPHPRLPPPLTRAAVRSRPRSVPRTTTTMAAGSAGFPKGASSGRLQPSRFK